MLDKVIGGYGHGYGHKDHRSSGYGFQEHKEFASHEESERGYFDRQARYDHHMRLPANHGHPPMTHMPICDEDSDSDVEEFYERSQSHHTAVLPHHGKNHHQAPHMNFMSPPPMAQPHHNGKMGNGWQGGHETAYHGAHGMQGRHGKHHGGGYGMQQHSVHGMQQHGVHGVHGMRHQDKLMAPHVPPHHVYVKPSHGSGDGRAVVMSAAENWRVSNSSGGTGWGGKGL